MKKISVGIFGASNLADQVEAALVEVGHEVYLIQDSDEQVLKTTPVSEDSNITAGPGQKMVSLDVILELSEQGATFSERNPTVKVLSFGVHSETGTNHRAGFVFWYAQDSCRNILCSAEYNFMRENCGASLVEKIEQIALAILLDTVNYVARNNGRWPTPSKDIHLSPIELSNLNFGRLAFWHQSNQTEKSYPFNGSLTEGFSLAVSEYPDYLAIVSQDAILTYRELLDYSVGMSVDLAKTVRSIRGVDNREQLIGIAIQKSAKLYAAMLAILGIGAAYVALDPTYPEERLKAIVQDASLAIVMTDRSHVPLFERFGLKTFSVPEYDTDIKRSCRDRHCWGTQPATGPDSLAVVIYTSGSTGIPKGVMLSQRNIVAFCNWHQEHVGLTSNSRLLQFSTVSFDASILDIFPTFLSGACLIVPTEEARHDFSALDTLIRVNRVSHAFLPPALLATLPDFKWPALQNLITGGDVCDPYTVQRWKAGRNLHNIYGPTECTVLVTTSNFSADSNRNIGRPISNGRCYLLDENMRPVKPGVAGEIYIAGAGVGRGYFENDLLTREKFLVDPLDPSRTMYRSGDIAKWTDDGDLVFIGRKDFQVKIREFRIELGEIESTALACNIFKQCVVVADSNKRIIAFVANPYVDGASGEQLKNAICKVIPRYMAPCKVIVLESLPATDHGKIDRNALLNMWIPSEVNQPQEVFTEKEQKLREMWAAIIGIDIEEIGKSQSFFDLGGHSLLVSAP